MPIQENWQRSYRIVFGTFERDLTDYNQTQLSASSGIPAAFIPKQTDNQTIPSDALIMSNLAEDGNDLRGFTFELNTTRSLEKANRNTETTTINLYNLDARTLDVLQKEGAIMQCYAGYGGSVTLAYAGDIVKVVPIRSGSDSVYQITCKDGGNDEKNTKISINYIEGTTDRDIILDLVNRYPGTTLGTYDLATLSDRVETGGRSFSGKLVTSLSKFMDTQGLKWGRFNNKFIIAPYRLDDEFSPVTIYRDVYQLTPSLIKTIGAQNSNGKKESADKTPNEGVVVNTYYIPIELGQYFTIPPEASPYYAGTYQANRIKTTLQSQGGLWDVAITGTKI